MSVSPFVVSAPGKVIIFGEHSAVYGKPAIAAALSLRCYLLVSPSVDDANTIRLQFPDIQLDHSWNINDIPWDEIKPFVKYDANNKPLTPSELVPEILDKLSPLLTDFDNKMHYYACFCFLYLYVNLCSTETPGTTFIVRSTLPIGAGLGSSASTSVCLSSALALLGGCISEPSISATDKILNEDIPDLEFVDKWSLIGEKCFHGNPSGIDNAVATFGGAVMFQRTSAPEQPSIRTNMRNFPAIKLLLTNTKVPKSTADLVAGVGKLNAEFNPITTSILTAMEHLSQEAYKVMITPGFGKDETNTLRKLVNINHGLLVALGVSHPSLETVKIIGDRHKIGATKLTGAGGGGCAITLVNDNVEESVIQEAIKEFATEGYESFETSLGGKGVGVLFSGDVSDNGKFSQSVFCNYPDRASIEDALGMINVKEWKFW
ncbi:Mevalonate kinase [Candida viswanathii]|uniref:Mevalonate kinase n=1 Tax=Candida viswanathii TaxID=5486 RepID=A0A367YFM8_9ASCO|nr:Mevalonate kinase [Candida viswanathii]